MSTLYWFILELALIFLGATSALKAYSTGRFFRAGYEVMFVILFAVFLNHDYTLLAAH